MKSNSQDFTKLVGTQVAKAVGAEIQLLEDRETLMRKIELVVGLPDQSISDIKVSNFEQFYYLQIFYGDLRTSLSADRLADDIITICERVTCTTTSCSHSASDCQPKYLNDCTACSLGTQDCKKQVHKVEDRTNNNSQSQ